MDVEKRPTLDWIEVRNYRSVRHATAQLTRLHAFIGPNDSGKSTLLRAIEDLVDAWSRRDSKRPVPLLLGSPEETRRKYLSGLDLVGHTDGWRFWTRKKDLVDSDSASTTPPQWRRASLVRFEADALRNPSGLIPEGEELQFSNSRGLGLPGIYLAVLSRGDETFRQLTEQLRKFFPTVKSLRVPAIAADKLVLEVELVDGTRVRADQMSEGLLYYLAYAVLPYMSPTSMLLIEEPETGLHPARIAEVVHMLRAMTEQPDGPQIIMATHSPLVINELKPEEVSVVTRPSVEIGTQVTRLMDTTNFAERSKVYALGELWLSYADGKLEAPLFEKKTP